MLCQKGHDHSRENVLVAALNLTEPHGVRPFHCHDCWQTSRTDTVPNNWRSMTLAQAQSQGRSPCRDCF